MRSPTPWNYEPNGDRPDVDGWHIFDGAGDQIALIEKEDDAKAITEVMNAAAARGEV